MFLLPCHRFTLSTPLNATEVIERMNEQVGPAISTDLMGKGRGDFDPFSEAEEMTYPYNGVVYEDYFAISRSVRGFPMPVIWGTVFEENGNTYVYVEVKPEMSQQFIVLFIFLGVFLLIFIAGIAGILMTGLKPQFLPLLAVFLIPYSIVLTLFYSELKITRSFLAEVLNGKTN